MLFQGQEFGASAPFLYFADHKPELAANVEKGRREFLSQFPSLAGAEAQEALAAPHDPETFERCRLDWSERARNASIVALHRDLLTLRRTDETFRQQRTDVLTGAVFSDSALALRWTLDGRLDRLLLVNLGDELEVKPVNEPILAPPSDRSWRLLWSSEANVPVDGDSSWRLPAECALVFAPSQ
jgi:maltooligosyltrehalose trehalohydrolase